MQERKAGKIEGEEGGGDQDQISRKRFCDFSSIIQKNGVIRLSLKQVAVAFLCCRRVGSGAGWRWEREGRDETEH